MKPEPPTVAKRQHKGFDKIFPGSYPSCMKLEFVMRAWYVAALACLCGPSTAIAEDTGRPALDDALKKISSQCPQDYPEKVIAVPAESETPKLKTATLIEMLESWNAAVRRSAAEELGKRSDSVSAELLKGTESDNWMVRAGVAAALTSGLKQKLNKWQTIHPDIKNYREAHEKIKRDSNLDAVFIRLAKDPRLEVRIEALRGLSLLAPPSSEAIEAILSMCTDADPYAAQDAMMILQKQFLAGAIQYDGVVDVLKKAMSSPLPRGRGSVVTVISKMDEADQRKFIPELLAHLDWTPNRDTMFGAGGQVDAVKILTKLRVKELIPRIPKLMNKTVRGTSLVDPCLDAVNVFGKDAKVLLPALRELVIIMKPTERDFRGNRAVDIKKRYDRLIETVKALQKL